MHYGNKHKAWASTFTHEAYSICALPRALSDGLQFHSSKRCASFVYAMPLPKMQEMDVAFVIKLCALHDNTVSIAEPYNRYDRAL